jgi:hypothetical protein
VASILHSRTEPRLRGHGAAGSRSVSADLLDLAIADEADQALWRKEFHWFLAQPAIRAIVEHADPDQPLTVAQLAGQQVLRFPVVSGDAEWLADRSMAVLARRLAPMLVAGAEVSVDLSHVARGDEPDAVRHEQLRLVTAGLDARLPGALARYGVIPRGLTFSAGADHPGLGSLLRIRESASLGRPLVAIRVPDRLLDALGKHPTRGESPPWSGDPHRLWAGLTELAHRDAGVALVLQHTSRPSCALAAGERGDAVLPCSLFEARAMTAWLAFEIDLAATGFGGRRADLLTVRRLLQAGLRLADNLMDQLDWTCPELGQDALVNRRLAVHVTGVGDVIDRLDLDPAAFPTVRLAVRWIKLLRRMMVRESNRLARTRGIYPGFEVRDLESTLSRTYGGDYARRVLRQAGLRHRHLLVLSPYGVFPRGGSRHPPGGYLHLLPVLGCADTVAMYGHGMRRALPLAAFRRLLQMTWAIARNRP